MEKKIEKVIERVEALQKEILELRPIVPIHAKQTHVWLRFLESDLANAIERCTYALRYAKDECPQLLQLEQPAPKPEPENAEFSEQAEEDPFA